MLGNLRPSEAFAVVSTIDPVVVANVEAAGDYVDMGAWESVVFIFLTGDMAAETVDFKLEQATAAAGTGKKDLVTATQLAAHASNNDAKQVVIECRASQLDVANNFRFVRPRMITGGATGGPCACVGLGFNARYNVGTDLATVVQITRPT
jgi:hypothetical protein